MTAWSALLEIILACPPTDDRSAQGIQQIRRAAGDDREARVIGVADAAADERIRHVGFRIEGSSGNGIEVIVIDWGQNEIVIATTHGPSARVMDPIADAATNDGVITVVGIQLSPTNGRIISDIEIAEATRDDVIVGGDVLGAAADGAEISKDTVGIRQAIKVGGAAAGNGGAHDVGSDIDKDKLEPDWACRWYCIE